MNCNDITDWLFVIAFGIAVTGTILDAKKTSASAEWDFMIRNYYKRKS